MANNKDLIIDYSQTGLTVYTVVRQLDTEYLLNDADGTFSDGPTDHYLSLTEHTVIKGKYTVSESRQIWLDGVYDITFYQQVGGSPSELLDTIIGSGLMCISDDTEITPSIVKSGLDRALGLMFENHVEDDIVRNVDGLKTSSTIYLYDTKANAVAHDKATGVISKYSVTVSYDTDNLVSLLKITKD